MLAVRRRAKRRHADRGLGLAPVIVAVVLLAAAVFVAVVAILPAPGKKVPPKRVAPVNVTVRRIEPQRDFRDTFTLPGSVEPNRVVRVAAEVAGRIEKIPSREGRPCQAGDRLVLLNTDLLQAEFDRAKATMDFDAREADRMAALAARGSATSNELDQARTKAAASSAALDAARARLERAVISAPIDGVLNRLPVEVGEYVSPGDVVAEVVDIDTALVVVDVPERDIRHLKVGQREEVRLEALGSGRLTGTIRYISEVADPNARTTRVEIELDNTACLLRSGQIVLVRLLRRVLPEVILIPLDAVIPLEKEYRVYVVADGKAQPRAVKLGFLKGRRVQVLSGLAPGDRLITRGQYYCGPGQAVQARSEDSAGADSRPAGGRATNADSRPASAPTAARVPATRHAP